MDVPMKCIKQTMYIQQMDIEQRRAELGENEGLKRLMRVWHS